MNTNDLARWIVKHGADKPVKQPECGIPLYLPIPERPADKPVTTDDYVIDYTV
jgi:hypothetical protein